MVTKPLRVSPRTLLTFAFLALLLVSWVAKPGTSLATARDITAKSTSGSTTNASHRVIPLSVPGVLQCIHVSLTLENDRFAHLQVAIGVDNSCPVNVQAPINWDFNSELSCGGETIAGPNDEGHWVNALVKNHMYTIVSEGFNITCIVDSVPAGWIIDMNAFVDGDIQYGDYDVASGSAIRSLGGF